MDELFDYLHAGVEFIESQYILLSKETQSGTLPEILERQKQLLDQPAVLLRPHISA